MILHTCGVQANPERGLRGTSNREPQEYSSNLFSRNIPNPLNLNTRKPGTVPLCRPRCLSLSSPLAPASRGFGHRDNGKENGSYYRIIGNILGLILG